MLFFPCVRVHAQISPLYKDTVPIGLGPHPSDLILTLLPLKRSSLPIKSSSVVLGVTASTYKFGRRGHNSTHNKLFKKVLICFAFSYFYVHVTGLIHFPLLRDSWELIFLSYKGDCWHSSKCPFYSGAWFFKHILLQVHHISCMIMATCGYRDSDLFFSG